DSNDQIPTKNDWLSDGKRWVDMETDYSFENYLGKSLSECMPLIENAPLGVAEDISYMPAVPFRYYVMAFKQYLLRPDVTNGQECRFDNSDAASTFLLLIKSKLTDDPALIMPVITGLLPVAEFVAANQE